MRLSKIFTGFVLAGVALAGSAAYGNSIYVNLTGTSVDGTGRTFVYDLSLSSGSKILDSGDLVAIRDFGSATFVSLTVNPAIGGSYSAASWTFSQPTTTHVIGVSDTFLETAALNVQLTYKGPPVSISNTDPLNNLVLGTLTVKSIYTDYVVKGGAYVSQDHKISDGSLQGNLGLTDIPVLGGPSVPLPASVWGGLLLAAAVAGRKIVKRRD